MSTQKLKTLFQGIDGIAIKGNGSCPIRGLASDSRKVVLGDLFFAKKGHFLNGTSFIESALRAGASAIVTPIYDPFLKVPQVIAPDPAALEALVACRFYGHPSKELFVTGVTGTKGKTTTSYWVQYLFENLFGKTGLIGTIEANLGGRKIPSSLTTQDAMTNQKYLKEMIDQGCQAAVLEVSSHGLDQGRVDGVDFDAALFTNLYEDHLDYHRTMEEYAKAKQTLFHKAKEISIFNAESPWAPFMSQGVKNSLFVGIEKGDLQAKEVRFTKEGIFFTVENVPFYSPLLGTFNLLNLLLGIGLANVKGIPLSQMAPIVETFSQIPGRVQKVANPLGLEIFVDFAHTKDALEQLLSSLRPFVSGRILLVFGAGGDRDPRRRASMGKVAEEGADLSIITSDNPRKEDPRKIAEEILSGFSNPADPIIEIDRKEAIRKALLEAKENDVIVIAGKGHETGQIFAHQTLPFDDVQVAQELCLQL